MGPVKHSLRWREDACRGHSEKLIKTFCIYYQQNLNLWRIILLAFKRRSRDITTRYSVPPPANTTHTRLLPAQDILIHLAHELKIEPFLTTTPIAYWTPPKSPSPTARQPYKERLKTCHKSFYIWVADWRWWWPFTVSIVIRHYFGITHLDLKRNYNPQLGPIAIKHEKDFDWQQPLSAVND